MYYKYVVVGSGYAGSIMARRIAQEKNEDVLVIEKHNHIAGHAFDYYNENGILIHKYGPHIFHTNSKPVWDFLSNYTDWHHYQHRVLAYVDGEMIPLPLSVETVNAVFGENLSVAEFAFWVEKNREKISDIKTSEDVVLSSVGRELYEKIFKNYTFKQWECYPNELDASVTKRIPFRTNRDKRYFADRYQGLPKNGYTKMFENILNHPKIHVLLNTNWASVKDQITYDKLIYTGPVDEFFNYEFGKLEYRSVRFEYETFFDREFYQDVGTVNYPNDYDFTRITEYKYLTGQKLPHTTIAREYSSAEGEPFYIIPKTNASSRPAQYFEKAKTIKNLILIGRLAEYKYYNMDQIVERALNEKL